jgi:hypothetical protein
MWKRLLSQYTIVPLHMGGASHLHMWAAHESYRLGLADRGSQSPRTRPVADVGKM